MQSMLVKSRSRRRNIFRQAAASNGSAIVQRLLQRVEHEAGMGRARGAPAHDPTRECVDDERDVDEALPSGDVGEVRDPQRVRPGRLELTVYLVERTGSRAIADRRLGRLAANHALQAHVSHQSRDRAPSHVLAFPF